MGGEKMAEAAKTHRLRIRALGETEALRLAHASGEPLESVARKAHGAIERLTELASTTGVTLPTPPSDTASAHTLTDYVEMASAVLDVSAPGAWCRARALRRIFAAAAVAFFALGAFRLVERGPNVAVGRPVLMSTVAGDPSAVTNGVVEQDEARPYAASTLGTDRQPWVRVDLGVDVPIDTIIVHPTTSDRFAPAPPTLAVEVSQDGVQFREVTRRRDALCCAQPWVVRAVGSGRYVRVRAVGHINADSIPDIALNEIEVYRRRFFP
jgi:hypothetical protein